MIKFNTSPVAYDSRANASASERYNLDCLNRALESFAKQHITASSTLADLGCGTLVFSYLYPGKGTVYAVDQNRKMTRFGMRKLGKRQSHVKIFNRDVFEETRIPDGSVDTVIAIGILDYIERARTIEFLKLCRKMLKSNGVLLLTSPVRSNVNNLLYSAYCRLRGIPTKNYYDAPDLEKASRLAGLRMISSRNFGTRIWVPYRLKSALIYRLFALLDNKPLAVILPPGAIGEYIFSK